MRFVIKNPSGSYFADDFGGSYRVVHWNDRAAAEELAFVGWPMGKSMGGSLHHRNAIICGQSWAGSIVVEAPDDLVTIPSWSER